jgi:hypothetical protein
MEEAVEEIPYGFCQCGCGESTTISKYNDEKNGYLQGVARSFRKGHNTKGELNWNWNGKANRSHKGTGKCRRIKHNAILVKHPLTRTFRKNGGYIREHVLLAELALGKELPPRARVHHVDHNTHNNDRNNLVVCENTAYHLFLHVRERALNGCGNVNWRKCVFCKRWDDPTKLARYRNTFRHRECERAYNANRNNQPTTNGGKQ